jgi:hypothetical protein
VALKNTIEKLRKFSLVDKYEAFYHLHPPLKNSADDRKAIISSIADTCCQELIAVFEAEKKPTKAILKKIITKAMNDMAKAKIDPLSRDFGYELCWYLSEISGINLKTTSENKVWGYWPVIGKEVQIVEKKSRKKSQ